MAPAEKSARDNFHDFEVFVLAQEIPSKVEERLAKLSDEELAFRGWTREGYRKRWAEREELDKTSPQIGDEAPDFELERLSPEGQRTGVNLRLSSLRGKPVGLIFGSFT